MSKKKTDSREQKQEGAKPSKKASEEKWGKPVMDIGYAIIPSLIFKAQRRLGLNSTQLTIIMHLADFWWEEKRKPYPSKKLLSERMNLSARQVQRHIADLEKMGLIKRVERYLHSKGRTSNSYDLSGLVARLKQLAPDFKEVEENVKKQRQEVAKPGLKNRKKISKAA